MIEVLLIDENVLQKGVQYHGGRLVGADRDGEIIYWYYGVHDC